VGARFSAPIQTGPEAHPASYATGTGSFPGVKRPGQGVDHPPTSSAEVKERVELYLYSPSGPLWPVIGWTLLYFTDYILALKNKYNVCKQPYSMQVESGLQSALHLHTVRLFVKSDNTRGCGDTIRPPEDEQRAARNMLRSVV